MSAFTYTVIPSMLLTNDFIVRRDVLEAFEIPLILYSKTGQPLWNNSAVEPLLLTPTEKEQIGIHITQDIFTESFPRPSGGRLWIYVYPLYNLQGDREAFLVQLPNSISKHQLDTLNTGVAIAQNGRFLLQNRAMGRLLGRDFSGCPWEECKDLPAWNLVSDSSVESVVVQYAGPFELHIHQAFPFVLVEGYPKLVFQDDTLHSELVAQLVHEIRNPLAAIGGYVELASTHSSEGPIQDWLNEARDEVDRLSRLTDDLRYLARPIQLHRRNSALTELVQRAWHMVAPGLRQTTRLQNRIADNLMVRVDPDRFHQVLLNLFKNAVEAMSDQDGQLEVEAETSEEQIAIVIRDNGPGFPADVFQQLGTRVASHKPGGNGLGLLVSRTLIDAHEGTLTISSNSSGTTVKITLPAVDGELGEEKGLETEGE